MDSVRMCDSCQHDIDAVSAIPCSVHVWHKADDDWDDMCCKCGVAYEMMWK